MQIASKVLSSELAQELVSGFDSGKSVLELSKLYGISRPLISRVLKEANRVIRRGRPPIAKSKSKTVSASKSAV